MNHSGFLFFFFFLDFIYLLILKRGEGRKREREGNIDAGGNHPSFASRTHPDWARNWQARHVLRPRIEPATFCLVLRDNPQPTEPCWSGPTYLYQACTIMTYSTVSVLHQTQVLSRSKPAAGLWTAK